MLAYSHLRFLTGLLVALFVFSVCPESMQRDLQMECFCHLAKCPGIVLMIMDCHCAILIRLPIRQPLEFVGVLVHRAH